MQQTRAIQSSFSSDVLKLVTGTTGAQIITILAYPVLTRLYGPEAFGFFALFASIAGILGVIACLRYELAIVLPKDDREAVNLLALCLLCVALVSGLTVFAMFFGGNIISSTLNSPGLTPYLMLVPVFVFVNGIFLAFNNWNTRTRHFGRLSVARITSAVTTTASQLIAGVAGFATGGSLIGAYIGGSAVSTIVLGGQILRDDHQRFREGVSRSLIIEAGRRYRKFPLYDTFSALISALSWQLPALLLASFFSPIIVGFYALGFQVLQLPMNLIGAAISQVFFQRAAEAHKSETLAPLVKSILTILLKIVMYPMLILAIVGPDLFAIIFGAVWSEAGTYIQILSVWGIFWFVASPISLIYVVLENQRFGLLFNSINLISRFLSLLIGGVIGSVYLALGLFSVSGAIINCIYCLLLVSMSGVPIRETMNIFFKAFAFVLPFLGIVVVSKLVTSSSLLITIIAGTVGVAYFVILFKSDPQIQKIVFRR